MDAAFVWPAGLTEEEAASRRRDGGRNQTGPALVRSWSAARRESIFTVFNLNLVGLAVVQTILSDFFAAAITLLMLGFTTAIRLLQEGIAARRLARYREVAEMGCQVIRDARLTTVDPGQVVAGDVLVAGPGDQIVADGPLLGPGPITLDTSVVAGRRDWMQAVPGDEILAGSFCVAGRAVYRADRIGADRHAHDLVAGLAERDRRRTTLERVMSRIMTVLFGVVAVFAALLLAKYLRLDVGDVGDLLVDAAPVIFSLVPTGLYLMIIVSYAVGTADLAQDGALVRSARSVEALAESTVLCFTELGLLAGTSLEIRSLPVPGLGSAAGRPVPESRIRQVLGDLARSTSRPNALSRLIVDSFEGDARIVRDEEPHLTTRGWSGIAFGEPDAAGLYVLGTRKALQGRLVHPLPDDVAVPDPAAVTLLLAYRPDYVPLRDADGTPALPDGLIAGAELRFKRRADRGETLRVIEAFQQAGVRVKVFAGGGTGVAERMLRAAGLLRDPVAPDGVRGDDAGANPGGGGGRIRELVTRADLEAMPEEEWGDAASGCAVFSGLLPVQVGGLVRALRERGEVVTVVGDGVNDLPAFAEASLAVAQPASTQAALGLADIVLLVNRPDALLAVFRRGHAIVRSLLDVIKLNLTLVLSTALLISYVRIAQAGFPYAAGHGSIIAILTGTIPSIVMGLWPPPGVVVRRDYGRLLARFVVPAGVALSLVALAVYQFVLATPERLGYAQLVVAYTLLYSALVLNVIIRRTRVMAMLASALALVATFAPVVPYARRQFRLDWLEPADYLIVLAGVGIWFGLTVLCWTLLGEKPLRGPDGRPAPS